MKRCEICRGDRIVRLPIYREVSAIMSYDTRPPEPEAMSRTYPCPECGGKVSEERIAILDTHAMVDKRIDDPGLQEHAKRTAAHMLIDLLLSGGYIDFERGRPSPMYDSYPVVATLGVVSKGRVASIEERATERGKQLATAAAVEAIKQIDNWGSASRYVDHRIEKARARDFIQEAVKTVSAAWSKARAIRD